MTKTFGRKKRRLEIRMNRFRIGPEIEKRWKKEAKIMQSLRKMATCIPGIH